MKNDIVEVGETARVQLANGHVAIIDSDAIGLVAPYRWHSSSAKRKHRYAMCRVMRDGKAANVFMHRLVIDAPPFVQVDHINCDTLDNRRINLRLCSHAENVRNSIRVGANREGYKGVWRHGRGYYASIQRGTDKVRIGPFSSPQLAAAAYAGAATILFGEFARFDLL